MLGETFFFPNIISSLEFTEVYSCAVRIKNMTSLTCIYPPVILLPCQSAIALCLPHATSFDRPAIHTLVNSCLLSCSGCALPNVLFCFVFI